VTDNDDRSDEYREAWAGADNERPLYPAPSAPYDVAKKLYGQHRTADGLRTLLSWRGGFMQWETTHWAELDAAHLRSGIYDTLGAVDYLQPVKDHGETVFEERPWSPDKRKIANVMEAMAAIGYLDTNIDPPSWTDLHIADAREDQIISCRNGLLNLADRELTDHTPAFFNVVSVAFDYTPDPPKPTEWLRFLNSVWGDDLDSIALLQEYVGYILSGRTNLQKMLLIVGTARSGKGTIARMLERLIGPGHVAHPTIASFASNFGLSPLIGKPLAIIPDARVGNTNSPAVLERLLSITGEDGLTIDRKFRDPYSGRLPTRLVMLSNELPRFHDSSGAITNRLLILQTTVSFLGREDRDLDNKIAAELPGILAWALEGLDRLNTNGRFTEPQSSRDAAVDMMDLASPVSAFVRERCKLDVNSSVSRDALYSEWRVWADDNGHERGSKATFGRNLKAAYPKLGKSHTRANGEQVWRHTGIELLPLFADDPVAPVAPGPGTGNPPPPWDAKRQVSDAATRATGNPAVKSQHNGAATGKLCIHCHEPCSVPGQVNSDGQRAHLICQRRADAEAS
jgi:putative DNA primase/helicase